LQTLLADSDPASDPVLISVCAPGDDAKARIKGSINIPRGAFWETGQPRQAAAEGQTHRRLLLFHF
jgi:hypothetical protein